MQNYGDASNKVIEQQSMLPEQNTKKPYKCPFVHRHLGIETVDEIIEKYARSHERRLHHHENVETIQLRDTIGLKRRLNRLKPFELAVV